MTQGDADPVVPSLLDKARVIEGARAIEVSISDDIASALARYLDFILDANRRINLTAVRDKEQACVLHAVDSLAIARAIPDAPTNCFDLGTGNGFPGVAAALLWPLAKTVLCDRTRKKLDVIAAGLAHAGIKAETLWADADQLRTQRPELRNRFDLICARAVGEPALLARAAAPLLRNGGRLALWLTAEDRPPVRLAAGLERESVVRYELPAPAARSRAICVWVKR